MRAAVAAAALCCAAGAEARGEASAGLSVLLYDSQPRGADPADSPLERQLARGGWTWRKVGQGGRWEGFGTKVRGIIKALANMGPDDLAIVADAYDVLLNPMPDAARVTARRVAAAVASHPGAVIASAESQCCVNALSRAQPGSLIAQNGTRTARACSSRSADCQWRPGGEAPWVEFMTSLARSRGPRSGEANPFLNAGLMAGRASDLLAVYSALKASGNEDDQALMTEFLFRYPERITLDYDQELFGNNRWRKGGQEGCMFEKSEEGGHLIHRETQTTPAFLHTSGQFWGCYRALAEAAGVQLPEEVHRRKAEALGYGYTAGDPFTTYAGKRTQFYLPLGEEMKLIACGDISVYGRTMASGIAGDSQQWFDKIRVSEAGAELVSVEVQTLSTDGGEKADADDVTLASLTARISDALSLIRERMSRSGGSAELPLTTIAVNVSGVRKGSTVAASSVQQKVAVHRDASQPIGACCFAERVAVGIEGFAMEVRSSIANKFLSAADQVSKLHLDMAFTKVDASKCTGMLPEIWGVRPLTAEHMKLLSPPQ